MVAISIHILMFLVFQAARIKVYNFRMITEKYNYSCGTKIVIIWNKIQKD